MLKINRYLKPLLGVIILVVLVNSIDLAHTVKLLEQLNPAILLLALCFSITGNLLCAYRWERICKNLRIRITRLQAITIYFQSVAANTILPGGIIGGDAYRISRLIKFGANSKSSAKTILLDRYAGFWALATLSFASLNFAFFFSPELVHSAGGTQIFGYAIGLILLTFFPFLVLVTGKLEYSLTFHAVLHSLISQASTIAALWLCFYVLDESVGFVTVMALSILIFLAAALPASIGGFGTRELASVYFLAIIGVSPETAFTGSILFGALSIIQGIFSAVTFFATEKKIPNEN